VRLEKGGDTHGSGKIWPSVYFNFLHKISSRTLNMHISHVAIWTQNPETLQSFYETCFSAQVGQKYTNPKTGFESCFLTFESGARLELMRTPGVTPTQRASYAEGYAHMAFSTGSRKQVDRLTARLEAAGCTVTSQPRTTGDGYYESVVLDPNGNVIEITE
jgi:lactoylglutathione lyase